MLSFLAMLLALTGRWTTDPPSPPSRQRPEFERVQKFATDQLLYDGLKQSKSGQIFLSKNIELFEKLLMDPNLQFSPAVTNRIQNNLVHWREEVQFMEKEQQEYERWLQERKVNPGPETDAKALARLEKLSKKRDLWEDAWKRGVNLAPPPREKK